MKKRSMICIALCALMLILSLAGCKTDKPDGPSSTLESARSYLFEMYKNEPAVTPSDFRRVSVVRIGDNDYKVTWSADSDKVAITDDGKFASIDVDEKTPEEVKYKLTATLSDAEGNKTDLSFDYTIPAYAESGYAEFAAAENKAPVVVRGTVTGIIAKSKGNSSNGLYVEGVGGGYYVYNMSADPVADLGLAAGSTVSITGKKDTYNGTLEIIDATVEKTGDGEAVTPADYTEAFKNAKSLKDEALTGKQAALVTIKGVEITGEDAGSGYYKFKLGELESYIRISSSVCPLTKEDAEAFKKAHAEHLGWTADATGVVCVYDGAFYLTPVTKDAFEYKALGEKTAAEKIEFEKANLTVPEKVTKDGDIDLQTTGKSYTDVAISYASDNACAAVSGGKLTVKLPAAETKVKLTATFKCGTETATADYIVTVDAASAKEYTVTKVTTPETGKAYKFGLTQAKLEKDLWFSGEMSGNYFALEEKVEKGVDVFLEAQDGGYRMYFMKDGKKNYLDIYEYTAGKAGVRITDTPSAVYTFDAGSAVLIANVAGSDRYLGTYNTYSTISASATSYITGENAKNVGVTQFPAYLFTAVEKQ